MRKLGLVALVVGAIGLVAATQFAFAQTPGEVITFLLPAAADQPEPPNGPTDGLVYTGGPFHMIDASTCGGGTSNPVQNAVLVDPGPGGRSGRIVGVVSFRPSELPPGTKLGGITYQGFCTVDETDYKKYDGTVE